MKSFRNNWIEFCPKFGFSFKYEVAGFFDSRPMIVFCLFWGAFYIHLPFDTGIDECEPPRYGFYWYESALWFCVGKKVYAWHMPWSFDWKRTSYLLKTGEWDHEFKGKRKDYWKDEMKELLWQEKHPYTYKLKNGDIQERIATISITEREWRRKFLMWTPIFNKVVRSLDVNFSDEVGEESGSWKGGCIGCSTTILPNENPLDVLRRMEKERIFN